MCEFHNDYYHSYRTQHGGSSVSVGLKKTLHGRFWTNSVTVEDTYPTSLLSSFSANSIEPSEQEQLISLLTTKKKQHAPPPPSLPHLPLLFPSLIFFSPPSFFFFSLFFLSFFHHLPSSTEYFPQLQTSSTSTTTIHQSIPPFCRKYGSKGLFRCRVYRCYSRSAEDSAATVWPAAGSS